MFHEMTDEGFSAIQGVRSKERWKKVPGSKPSPNPKAPLPVIPRTQETRTAQVFGSAPFGDGEVPSPDIWHRVKRRLKRESGNIDWNREQFELYLTLQEFAKDYAASGQREKATQVYLVLYKETAQLAAAQRAAMPKGLSEEELTRMENEAEERATALSDEELARE